MKVKVKLSQYIFTIGYSNTRVVVVLFFAAFYFTVINVLLR
jgi:hypothetical protein